MEIELTEDMIESIGIGKLKRFGIDEEWKRYHSTEQLDLSSLLEEDLKYLQGLLESIKNIRKVKSRLYDIKIFLKSKDGDSSSKIYKLIHLRSLLINYLKDLKHHWIFKTSKEDSNVKVAYYINDIEYHRKIPGDRHTSPSPAHVDIEFVYEKFGKSGRSKVSFEDNQVYGKTVSEILLDAGYIPENDELIENYDKEIKRYKKLFNKIGKQFTINGTADSEGESWRKSTFKFSEDKMKNRVVIDTLDDDEDKEDRRKHILFELNNKKEIIKRYRIEIDKLKKELDFIRGHYDKTWEEAYL